MTVDTYLGCVLSNAIIAAMFGIFKCTNFAEVFLCLKEFFSFSCHAFISQVLYSVSQLDSQLELKEKHYDKVSAETHIIL